MSAYHLLHWFWNENGSLLNTIQCSSVYFLCIKTNEVDLCKYVITTYDTLFLAGISLFTKCSSINFGPAGGTYVSDCKRTAQQLRVEHVLFTNNQIMRQFPFLTIGEGNEGILQTSKCGMVNPRKLVLAQKTAAHMQGCHIVVGVVDQLREKRQRSGDKLIQIVTEDGRVINTRKVLLCTGAFTLTKTLLPIHLQPDMKLLREQTLCLEVGAHDMKTFQDMPTMCSMTREDDHTDCYICPPVMYPNGKLSDDRSIFRSVALGKGFLSFPEDHYSKKKK